MWGHHECEWRNVQHTQHARPAMGRRSIIIIIIIIHKNIIIIIIIIIIEDACGESPAASYFGLFPWVKFKLFAHYSFIIRSLFVHYSIFICEHSRIMQRKPSKSDVSVPGAILGSHALARLLGASWGVLRRSWAS